MRVMGWAADFAGCHWYRLKLPFDQLAARGHEVVIDKKLTVADALTYDVVVGQRVCLPGPTGLWQKLHRQPNRPLMVYEIDDDLTTIDPSNRDAWEFFNQPGIQSNMLANIQLADLVTVSTEPLADVMRLINPNVVVLPNCVPAWLLDHQVPARTDGVVTLGWQGSYTHHMDWEGPGRQVERLFKLVKGRPSVELHLMGAPPSTVPRVEPTRFTPWVGDVPDYYRSIDWHLALAPLRPHIFNRSKSPLRLLEAAALGIPTVASAAGPYEGFLRHGETGYLARQDHEWVKQLRALILDPDLRAEMGANARKQASEWTIEERSAEWEAAYVGQLAGVGAR